jgi:capsular exopolysaccharide synthesis family protein
LDLDLRQLIRMARHWWWLLILAPLVAGGTAYWSLSNQQPLYSATATLYITQPQNPGTSDLSGLQAGERLGATYQQLVATDPVLNAVISQLNLPFTLSELRGMVSASAVTGTQLLKVSVSDTDPARAATIANGVAKEFSDSIARQSTELSSTSRQALDKQITDTESQISALTTQIQGLEQSTDANSPATQAQIASLRVSLNQLQTSYGNLLVQRQEMELNEAQIQNRVTVWEQARVPTAPYAPRTSLYTALALFAGLVLAVGGVVLIEYLDNTVKGDTEFTDLINAPVLSAINLLPHVTPGRHQLFVLDDPKSSVSEAIRLLRANIEFAAATREIALLGVTSANSGEGKSTTIANLAVAMAQGGYSVAIVDADLRRPSQHRIFEVSNERGLTTLITHPADHWASVAVNVGIPNLVLVPSGPLPPSPADLLSLERFKQILRQMSQSVDMVLVDTPPVLAVSDPLVVAPQLDGMIFVVQANRTRTDAVRRAVGQLRQGNARILGVVINRQKGRGADYYYYGYGAYYGPDEPGKSKSNGHGRANGHRPVAETPDEEALAEPVRRR